LGMVVHFPSGYVANFWKQMSRDRDRYTMMNGTVESIYCSYSACCANFLAVYPIYIQWFVTVCVPCAHGSMRQYLLCFSCSLRPY
jgi:hypothetical protein